MDANAPIYDQWTENLIKDLEDIHQRAQRNEFHDFKTELAAPKTILREMLLKMAQAVVDGKYDNEP